MYLRPAMPVVVLLCLSLIAQGVSGQLTGATGGLDSDALNAETATALSVLQALSAPSMLSSRRIKQ